MVLQPNQAGWRLCLGGCDKKFWSKSAGNRICPKCSRTRKVYYQPRVVSATIYIGDNSHSANYDDWRVL